MKADPYVKNAVVNSLENNKMRIIDAYKYFTSKIKNAETVEEIMAFKTLLLSSLVAKLPLGPFSCYFCIAHDGDCLKCEYGRVHGVCDADDDSDYAKICKARTELLMALESYYRGETYDGE